MQKIDLILEKLIKNHKLEKGLERGIFPDLWKEISYEKIATVSSFKGFKSATLYIGVDGDSWRNQLLYLREEMRKKMNLQLGKELIEEIVFLSNDGRDTEIK